MQNPKRIAITLGDPCGVGPEVIIRAWDKLHQFGLPFVIGSPVIVNKAIQQFRTALPCPLREITSPAEVTSNPNEICCLPIYSEPWDDFVPGKMEARGGQAAYDALVLAAQLALDHQVDAIVTTPLCKQTLQAAGHDYPGHTELLGELCGVNEVGMMLYLAHDELVRPPAGLGVVHVTLHNALRDVFERLNSEAILAKTQLIHAIMKLLKGSDPRLGVCALNPHAGEGGLFGNEEAEIILPAVSLAKAQGLNVEGPLATDTLFANAAREGLYDGIVAMYHDQGHIALKLLGFHSAVNITLGLPIIRTSVAHGTAFDIAWLGKSNPNSLIEAFRVAALLAQSPALFQTENHRSNSASK